MRKVISLRYTTLEDGRQVTKRLANSVGHVFLGEVFKNEDMFEYTVRSMNNYKVVRRGKSKDKIKTKRMLRKALKSVGIKLETKLIKTK